MLEGSQTLFIYLKLLDVALLMLICLICGLINWYTVYKYSTENRERLKDFLVRRNTLLSIIDVFSEIITNIEHTRSEIHSMLGHVNANNDFESQLTALEIRLQDECRHIAALKTQIGCLSTFSETK